MTYVIKCVGVGADDAGPQVGLYLRDWDLEDRGGRGSSVWVADIYQAAPFASLPAAMGTWKAQCASVPLRPDGKPNRPLTMYSVEITEGGGVYQAVPHDVAADQWYVANIHDGIPYPHAGSGFLGKAAAQHLADTLNRDYLQEMEAFDVQP